MNTKTKIATGTIAGLIAGTTLVGAAFAAPRAMMAPLTGGYGMMRSLGNAGTTAVADMNSFMDRYRAADGAIDFNRMHADVASGTVTMPHTGTGSRRGTASRSGSGSTSATPGSNMMGGPYGTGYNMMGSTY